MRPFLKSVQILLLVFLAGCIVIDGKHQKWEIEEHPIESDGPGQGDANFVKLQKNKVEYDDGRNIAIGLFPGFPDFWRQDRDCVGVCVGYLMLTSIANCYLLVPTIDSLLCEPFASEIADNSTDFEKDVSCLGLIGCHRWKTEGGTRLIEHGPEEIIVRDSGKMPGKHVRLYANAYGRNADGTKVFFLFPGFGSIWKVVRDDGRVDVLFPGGESRYRRFSRAKSVKDAIAFKDEPLTKPVAVPEKAQGELLKCWRDEEVPLEDRATIYLLLPETCFAAPEDQARVAAVLKQSSCWAKVFDKMQSDNVISDAKLLLDFAEGKKYKGIGHGKGDGKVALWAVEKLPVNRLERVVCNSVVAGAREKALERIDDEKVLAKLLLSTEFPAGFRKRVATRLMEMNLPEECCRDIYLNSREFSLAKEMIQQLGNESRATEPVANRTLQWLRDKNVPEDDLAVFAEAVVGDQALSKLALDKRIARRFREAAAAKIGESGRKDVYCSTDEFWLAKTALRGLSDSVRGTVEVTARSRSWFNDNALPLEERAEVFLAMTGQTYDESEQQVVAQMLGLSGVWRDVLNKCVAENPIKDPNIRVALATKKINVDDSVALWAVEGLSDEDLITVLEACPMPEVGIKAVMLLRHATSLERVALGDFGTVVRLGAINRLTDASRETLRKIALSGDPHFRSVAMERIKALGLPVAGIQAEADEIAGKEAVARKVAEEELLIRRETAIRAAEQEMALAKADRDIASYRAKLYSGEANGLRFSFTGKVLSIVSRTWKPRMRIEVKGAKDTLYVVCEGAGRLFASVTNGDVIAVDGQFEGGTDAEVFLSDTRCPSNEVDAEK